MVTVRIPPILRPEAGGQRELELEGATVREALTSLVSAYPALADRVLSGDELPRFLNVFVDGDDVRLSGGLDAPLREGALVLLLPAVAGGRR